MFSSSAYRAQLFKTNDIVSYRDVKISNVSISNMPTFFVEKMREAFALQTLLNMREAFAVQKLLSFFQQKYHCIDLVIKF